MINSKKANLKKGGDNIYNVAGVFTKTKTLLARKETMMKKKFLAVVFVSMFLILFCGGYDMAKADYVGDETCL